MEPPRHPISYNVIFFFCVGRYRANQIASPVDVMNRAVSSTSAADPHGLVLRSAPTGQVWSLLGCGQWEVLQDVC